MYRLCNSIFPFLPATAFSQVAYLLSFLLVLAFDLLTRTMAVFYYFSLASVFGLVLDVLVFTVLLFTFLCLVPDHVSNS